MIYLLIIGAVAWCGLVFSKVIEIFLDDLQTRFKDRNIKQSVVFYVGCLIAAFAPLIMVLEHFHIL